MPRTVATRLFALAVLLAASACTPVFATNDQAGLSPITFVQPATSIAIGQR